MSAQTKSKDSLSDSDRKANLAAALAWAAEGVPVFPAIVSRRDGDPHKKDVHSPFSWSLAATTDPKKIRAYWKKYPDATPGIPTGRAFDVVDLDGVEREIDAPMTTTPREGGQHYFVKPGTIRSSVGLIADDIDTRGPGGFVFAPGGRTIFGVYDLGDLVPTDILANLGEAPAWVREGLEHAPADWTPTSGAGEADLSEIADALGHVKAEDLTYQEWVAVLMAVHHGTGGSAEGLELADHWSAQDGRYQDGDVEKRWKGLKEDPDARHITVASLYAKASENGWRATPPVTADAFDDDLEDDPDDLDALLGTAPKKKKPGIEAHGFRLLSPDDCVGLKPTPYVVRGLVGRGQVGAIVGPPGAGKSVLAPWIGYHVAQGADVFGRKTKAGPVLYIAAEDDRGLAQRVHALRDRLGPAPDHNVVWGVSDLLTAEKGERYAAQVQRLRDLAEDLKPRLVIIDTIAAAFPGLEENDAAAMGRVQQAARLLSKVRNVRPAVLLIAHDAKAGGGLVRGHSILNGDLDVSVALTPSESGVVTARATKNRNGPLDVELAFRVVGHQIGEDELGDPVTVATLEPADPAEAKAKPTDGRPTGQPGKLLALAEYLASEGGKLDQIERVGKEELREAGMEHAAVSTADSHDSRKKAFNRALNALLEGGFLFDLPGHFAFSEPMEDKFDD